MGRILLALALLLALPGLAAGQVAVDEERLEDPAKEAKARAIMAEIRCLVCKNQSIENSNARLAEDLREIVREQVAAGRSEEEIKAFLVERYGDWVLMRPPVSLETIALWAFPPVILALVAGAAIWRARAKRAGPQSAAGEALSRQERARLEALMHEEEG